MGGEVGASVSISNERTSGTAVPIYVPGLDKVPIIIPKVATESEPILCPQPSRAIPVER